MSRFRYSLLSLFGVVTFAAMGSAALANPSKAWSVCATTAAFGLLLVAVLMAICGRGKSRAFWIGFAVFGGGYTWFYPEFDNLGIPDSMQVMRGLVDLDVELDGNLITTWLLQLLSGRITAIDGMNATPDKYNAWLRFMAIGQSLWTLLIAFVGGLIARYVYLRRERREQAMPKN